MSKHRDADPFEVIGRIPKGRAYQWVALPSDENPWFGRLYDQIVEAGWKRVPASRHPKMSRKGRHVVVGDQVLMEKDAAKVAAARDRDLRIARDMAADNAAGKFVASPGYYCSDRDEKWSALEPELGAFPSGDGQPRIVEVTLGVKLGANLVEAAAICALPIEEYTRRMIALILRGDLPGILQPTLERDAWEVRQLTTEKSK